MWRWRRWRPGPRGRAPPVPVAGAIKLAAAVAAAAAVGLWLGTWSASRPAAPSAARAGKRGRRSVCAPRRSGPGSRNRGGARRADRWSEGPGPGPHALAAAAPGRSRAGTARRASGAAAAGGDRPSEAIQNAMQVGNAPSKGDPKAPVTIVMFIDFQCPFSARAQPALMAELLAAYPKDIRLVVKNLPLPFHEHAKLAAEAALAAHEQGKFWAMHDRLFANQKALDPPALEEHARAIGLDVPRFRKALEDKRFLAAVEEDMRVAKEAGITGTPTFLINGKMLEGGAAAARFKELVDASLAKAPSRPRPRPARNAAARGAPLGERQRMDVTTRDWPPARFALPDELLGERLAFAIPTGDAPSLGAARAPVEVLYLFGTTTARACGWGKRMVDHLRGRLWRQPAHRRPPSALVRPARPRGSAGRGGGLGGPRAGQVLADARQAVLPERRARRGPPSSSDAAEIGLDLD